MSYDPLKVIAALKSMPGVATGVLSAVTGRIVILDGVTLAKAAEISIECGLSPDLAFTLRQLLQQGGGGMPSPSAAASGAPSDVVRVRLCN